MGVKAVLIDLDGTTLPCGRGVVSRENWEALEEAGTRGVMRVLATGRSVFSLQNALPSGLPIDYMVFSSGAGVLRWKDQRVLATRELSVGQTREIATFLWSLDVNFTIQGRIPDNHYFYYRDIVTRHEDFHRRVENYPGLGTPLPSPMAIHEGATQFLVILDARQQTLHEKIRRKLAGYSVIRATSPIDNEAIWTEIFAPGVNKGSSCEILLKQLGITYAECAGLGNDYNDIDFLERCGHPFVVANAPEVLLERFTNVATDVNNGLAEFMTCVSHL